MFLLFCLFFCYFCLNISFEVSFTLASNILYLVSVVNSCAADLKGGASIKKTFPTLHLFTHIGCSDT